MLNCREKQITKQVIIKPKTMTDLLKFFIGWVVVTIAWMLFKYSCEMYRKAMNDNFEQKPLKTKLKFTALMMLRFLLMVLMFAILDKIYEL